MKIEGLVPAGLCGSRGVFCGAINFNDGHHFVLCGLFGRDINSTSESHNDSASASVSVVGEIQDLV